MIATAVTLVADSSMRHDETRVPVVLGVILVVLLVARRTRPSPVEPHRMLVWPLIIAGFGVLIASPAAHGTHTADVALVACDLALSIALGCLRGRSVLLRRAGNAVLYRYGTATVTLWVVSAATRVLAGVVGAHRGATAFSTTATVVLMVGVSLLTQNLVVLARVRPSRVLPSVAR